MIKIRGEVAPKNPPITNAEDLVEFLVAETTHALGVLRRHLRRNLQTNDCEVGASASTTPCSNDFTPEEMISVTDCYFFEIEISKRQEELCNVNSAANVVNTAIANGYFDDTLGAVTDVVIISASVALIDSEETELLVNSTKEAPPLDQQEDGLVSSRADTVRNKDDYAIITDDSDYCQICGPGRSPSEDNDNNAVDIPTQGRFTCKQLDKVTKSHVFDPICALVQYVADRPCGCVTTAPPPIYATAPELPQARISVSSSTSRRIYYDYSTLLVICSLTVSTFMIASSML